MTGPAPASRPAITRLAPSPTGALHLGNARTFLLTWALARRRGWRILLRIEDLDGPRIKPGAADAIADTLRWLGIDWDDGPVTQSHDLDPYRRAMCKLAGRRLTYPSDLTRTQIEAAASAPQEGVRETFFSASLRPVSIADVFDDDRSNWFFVTPEGAVVFSDEFAGWQSHDPSRTVGDFVIWTKRGHPAYQLAVVVDDHRQGVTHVVRGDDLLDSAARQLLLYRALGAGPEPAYIHVPLVRGEDGLRLAKRHGDTRVDRYRQAGAAPERVIGLIGGWCGVGTGREPLTASEFAARLDLSTMSRSPITFRAEDDAWLLQR